MKDWVQFHPKRLFPTLDEEAWQLIALIANKYANGTIEILDEDFASLPDCDVATFFNLEDADLKIEVKKVEETSVQA